MVTSQIIVVVYQIQRLDFDNNLVESKFTGSDARSNNSAASSATLR
jgi:hypothetical protein